MKPMAPMAPMTPMQPAASGWWPAQWGSPGSAGSQNDRHYAYFPETHRLAIKQGGELKLYDTGTRRINGFAQQQGRDDSLRFTTGDGTVALSDLIELVPT